MGDAINPRCYTSSMDFRELRRLVIVAMFSDDFLLEQFVLKGGNALDLICRISSRTSLDVDLSIEKDFENTEEVKGRIFRSLKKRFGVAGYRLFDERIVSRPLSRLPDQDNRWGGYDVEFKVIEDEKARLIGEDLSKARRLSLVIGPDLPGDFRTS